MDKSNFIFSLPQLKEYLVSKGIDTEKAQLDSSTEKNRFFMLIPKYYIDLVDWYNTSDPLRKMVVSNSLEDAVYEYEVSDPIGDHVHEPVPGIVHRYPDRCLLMLTNICAVHCRFCFRKNLLETNKADFQKAMQYIETHDELWEVILSGGDPFMLTDHFLKQIMEKLEAIHHIKIVRFHTRTPAVYPARISETFTKLLSSSKQIIIVLHINHPREITPEFKEAIKKLKQTGATLLAQTVLLQGVNDTTDTLIVLFKQLVQIGIKPYYLHHLDPAAGTHYFRIPVEEGKKLYQSLRGTISGHCIPEYVIDTPGGDGKIPVTWFERISEKEYQAVNFEEKTIKYIDFGSF